MESFETEARQQPLTPARQQAQTPKPASPMKFMVAVVLGGVLLAIVTFFVWPMLFGGLTCDLDFCEVVHIPEGTKSCEEPSVTCSQCIEGYKDFGGYCAMDCQLESCEIVEVPKDTTSCDDPSVKCSKCNSGYKHFGEEQSQYCALDCEYEFCEIVKVAKGTQSCDEPSVTCSQCTVGYKDFGGYCALDCRIQGCSEVKVKKGTASCEDGLSDGSVTCAKCEEDHEFKVDEALNYVKTECVKQCEDWQLHQGCALGQCTSASQCKCAPGFIQHGMTCSKPDKAVRMEVYMYRAMKDASYHQENVNLGSAGGVMWYVHNEVVRICPRHYDIVKINRYKVTIHNPTKVFQPRSGQWGHFTQFDYGQCTVQNCPKNWQDFGYMVGCQGGPIVPGQHHPFYQSRFTQVYWYSLPGRCPSKRFDEEHKFDECAAQEPGGECPKPEINGVANLGLEGILPEDMPNGSPTCVWKLEEAGHVTLDELTGCHGMDRAWCNAGNREWVPELDKGVGCTWWDNRSVHEINTERTRQLLAKFIEKYPDSPQLFDPRCDGW